MNRLQELIERDQWAELLADSKRISDLSKNSDIEIMAFTAKEASKKASEIYGMPPSYFTLEEVTKGSVGMMGWFRIPSRFVATLKPEAQDMMSVQADYQKNDLAQNKNGSFRVSMRKTGLVLVVHSPRGLGAPVALAQIEKELELKGITGYNKELIHKALKEPELRVVIAPYVHSDNDSTFTVYTDKGNMSAYFSFTKPKGGPDYMTASMVLEKRGPLGRIPDAEEVVEGLKRIGVLSGINLDTINEVLDNELHDIPIVVAEGIAVEHGKNGYIEYTFPTGQDQFKHAVMPDGSVNFRELNIIHNVQKDDVLAIMHPPTLGIVGRNLLGESIQPNPGKEISWNIGDNTVLSRDGLHVLAASTGQVYLKNNQICVDTALEIGGDLDLTVGNIDFIGNVIIKGNVEDGFTVISGGNIEIHGHIGKSFIRAEGDIIAHKGIQGKDEAKIECAGNLYAKFVERAQLSIGHNLIVTDYILHSTISCSEDVIVAGGKRSIIAGGVMKVQGNVYAVQAGAESYVETHIEVGYPSKALRELHALDVFIKEKAEQIEVMKTEIGGLVGKINPDRMAKLEMKIFALQTKYDRAIENTQKLHAEIKVIQDNAFVSINKRIMPGIKLRIGDVILDNTTEQAGGSFFRKDKTIISGPYKTPQIFQTPTLKEDNKKR